MKKEAYEMEKDYALANKRVLGVDTLGTDEHPWYTAVKFTIIKDGKDTVDLPLRLMNYPEPEKVAILDTINSYSVLYGIPPEELLKQQAGSYEVIAAVAGVQSGKVVLNILNEPYSPTQLKSEAVQMQLANYYLNEFNLEKAFMHAENILRTYPNSIAGLMLRGEVRVRKNEYQLALLDFETALKKYRSSKGSKEPPEYIIGMVEGVKQKIATQRY
jgi:hypothetical protein